MKSMEELVDFYFRPNRLPHLWCPGCGNGVILGALLKAIDAENLAKDDVAIISGIGCSSRASGYVDFNTANTLHGRALPISTGLVTLSSVAPARCHTAYRVTAASVVYESPGW